MNPATTCDVLKVPKVALHASLDIRVAERVCGIRDAHPEKDSIFRHVDAEGKY